MLTTCFASASQSDHTAAVLLVGKYPELPPAVENCSLRHPPSTLDIHQCWPVEPCATQGGATLCSEISTGHQKGTRKSVCLRLRDLVASLYPDVQAEMADLMRNTKTQATC